MSDTASKSDERILAGAGPITPYEKRLSELSDDRYFKDYGDCSRNCRSNISNNLSTTVVLLKSICCYISDSALFDGTAIAPDFVEQLHDCFGGQQTE